MEQEKADLDADGVGLDANARQHALDDLRIGAQLRIGATTLPLKNILNIKVGDVIALDRALAAPVHLMAGGRTVASGELVVMNGFYGLKISKVSLLERHLPGEGGG
jgi:flagellar motor switch protein FliN/FliY